MNNKRQIVVWLTHPEIECFRFNDESLKKVKSGLPEFDIVVCMNSSEFKAALSDAYAVVVWVFKQEWFALAPRLKWLITPAAGKDYFKVSPPDGVQMHYCSFHGKIMAETVLAMMLASCRGVLPLSQMTDYELWPRAILQTEMRSFHGANVVVLGFGSIGVEVGRLSKALGANIVGIKKHAATAPDYFADTDRIILFDELDSILPNTDHLVLCLPRSTDTTNIINEQRLSLLPKHAWVYNVGRGNAINDDALVDALSSGQIAGACLDVYDKEPLPEDSVLRTAPNILLMPHASAFAPKYMELFAEELVELMINDQ